MAGRRRPLIANQRTAVWLGVALYLGGSVVLWDAYEHRSKNRPFSLRFLPGA